MLCSGSTGNFHVDSAAKLVENVGITGGDGDTSPDSSLILMDALNITKNQPYLLRHPVLGNRRFNVMLYPQITH